MSSTDLYDVVNAFSTGDVANHYIGMFCLGSSQTQVTSSMFISKPTMCGLNLPYWSNATANMSAPDSTARM